MPSPTDDAALSRLAADGLVRREGDRWRTTRRLQGALARAALGLIAAGRGRDDGDLRLPLALALAGVYADNATDAELAAMVEALLPIEARELAPAPPPP